MPRERLTVETPDGPVDMPCDVIDSVLDLERTVLKGILAKHGHGDASEELIRDLARFAAAARAHGRNYSYPPRASAG